MAPEVTGSQYDASVDVFSFGMVLWELLTGRIPWRDRSCNFAHQILQLVLAGERPQASEKELADAPREFISLMKQCWDNDPQARPTFHQALKDLRKIELSAKHAGWDIQSDWEIAADNVALGDEIGRGSFGVVRIAQYRGITVAVKTVDVAASREAKMQAKKLLLSEVKTLSRVDHPNVIQLIGACVDPPMLLMAHASGGTLRSLLDTCGDGDTLSLDR